MALSRPFQEFQLELLFQVAERLVDILVPSGHEPRGPHVGCLELVKVPPQKFTNFVFLCNDLVYGHRVIR
jgi:hypothetical protein